MKHIIYAVLLFSFSLMAQPKSPEEILEKVKNEFNKIEDYQVDVKIKVDVEFLKMSDREATIYYKKPDKFHIESENFAMLPKSSLNSSPFGFLNYNYTAFYVKEDTINGIKVSVVKVIPLEGDADVILSSFWIDTKRNLILKVESSRKPSGIFSINLEYLKIEDKFWLPSTMVFSFTIEPGFLPKRFTDEMNPEDAKKDLNKEKVGKVYLTYSNYKVNTDLPDSIFKEEKGK